ncbi:hypothetical protein VNI00_013717 [Paramarasmius palmivorus]|uniref:Cytochrome P450 n=1 Tax=Paramarasmius palmivorus TaxID=297713 RepID=A0AAW0C0E1_9AGAR
MGSNKTGTETSLIPCSQLKMGPGTAVVITDAAALKELMDKRSATTVDRPPNYIADAVAGGLNMVLARYTEDWRTLRRTAHTILTPQQCTKHLPIQKAEAIQLLYDMLQTPQSFYTHIRRYSNSVIMSVLYGKRCPRYETVETTAFFQAQHEWELLLEPGATPPLDLLPILKHVPERWAPWKVDVRTCRQHQRDLYFGLLDDTARRMESGEENGCYMEDVIHRQKEFGMDREITGYLGGVLLEGGSDTTSSFLQSLILAMVAFPEAQRKAQEELDRVVGPHRIPTLDDIEELPYVKAVIRETHRFRPVAPLMVPHATTAPEEYQGFFIPQGSTIFVNTCKLFSDISGGIFHDPALFDKPEIYNPDRYIITENGTKPGVDGSDLRGTLPFGCGRASLLITLRRKETDMLVFSSGSAREFISLKIRSYEFLTSTASGSRPNATASTLQNINTMNLLWAFEFSRASDPETGKLIDVDVNNYARGILTAPMPFRCAITPRSAERVELIEREFHEAMDTFSKFEYGLSKEDQEYVRKYRSP